MEAVLDTNVVVSGAINPRGHPAALIEAWYRGKFEWIVSRPILEELARVFSYPKVARYLTWTGEDVDRFLADLRSTAVIVEPRRLLGVIADPPDNRFLEAAVEGGAGFLVSGDAHLLTISQYEGIEIVTPARFRSILESAATGI